MHSYANLITTRMAMECNIDSRGRVVRFITGIFAILTGLSKHTCKSRNTYIWSYMFVIIGSILGGAFAMWEARAGWCVVRAIGIRTPL